MENKLNKPDKTFAIRSLSRVMPMEEAHFLWEKAIGSTQERDTDKQLEEVYKYLSIQPGVTAVIGRTLLIKLKAYRRRGIIQNCKEKNQSAHELSKN